MVPKLGTVGCDDTAALTDQHVVALAQRDSEAITAAYEAMANPVFRYVRSRCGDDELAADIVETTFVELLRAAPQLDGGVAGLRRWLFTAARHNLLDEQRKQRRRGDVALSDEDGADGGDRATGDVAPPTGSQRGQPGHADARPTPEEQVTAGERDADVRRALATLPDDQREVLRLRFAGELSAAEIGEIMQRSPGAVRVLQHRALTALAEALGHRHPEAPDDQVDAAVGDAAAHRSSTSPRGPPRGSS
jgi:RNA polymerase sigma-70 factor (ECF subfamily)